MAKIIIIGAGLTGLSAAYHLESRGFYDYLLLEAHDTPGGLCRSLNDSGFTFDYTGHLLHCSDQHFKQFITSVYGFDKLTHISRRSYIYSYKTYTRYPYQMNLYGLPLSVIAECIEGFCKRSRSKRLPKNFKEWVLNTFGEGIAKHFFIPFQSKILGKDLTNITTSWMGRFVPTTTLESLIQGALSDTFDPRIGYNSHFYYPTKGGINSFINACAHQLTVPIMCNTRVEQINLSSKHVITLDGRIYEYDTLINTMPLDRFLNKLSEPSNSWISSTAKSLKCAPVVNFNMGINRPHLTDKHWVYFPEKEFPFYRLGFPHTLTPSMVPEGCSSISGEFTLDNSINTSKIQKLIKKSHQKVKQLFDLEDNQIICSPWLILEHGYVIYDHWREKNLPTILQSLEQYRVHSIGRYGAWKYSSMQEAVLDGKAIAEKLTFIPAIQAHNHRALQQHTSLETL